MEGKQKRWKLKLPTNSSYRVVNSAPGFKKKKFMNVNGGRVSAPSLSKKKGYMIYETKTDSQT